MIRAVVFDLGGVFYPWPTKGYFERWAERLGVDEPRLHLGLWQGDDIEAANVGAISAEEYASRCAIRLGADAETIYELLETAFAGESLNEELAAWVRELGGRVRIAALTNTWSFGRKLLRRHRIEELFELVVTSAEEGVRKPDPRIYAIVAERLRLAPAEILFVDDAQENIDAARAAGFATVRFDSTAQAIAELNRHLSSAG